MGSKSLMMQWRHRLTMPPSRFRGGCYLALSLIFGLCCYCPQSAALSTSAISAKQQSSKPSAAKCPSEFRAFGAVLVKDLPSYLTRVYSRARVSLQVIGVGQPEFEPLALAPDQDPRHAPEQLFITVSERHSGEANNQQRAYWLFFVSTPKGWRLAMAFTRVGQAPPYDVSYGAISTATKEWLRDHCESF